MSEAKEAVTLTELKIGERLQLVMSELRPVSKDRTSDGGGYKFKFRGIDDVVKEISPLFAKHGISVTKRIIESSNSEVEVGGKRTLTGVTRVTCAFRYTSAHDTNDFREDEVIAEAMDSGDKATAKVMSVAYRTSLLQVLLIPTGDPDPDEDQYVRSQGKVAPTDEEIEIFTAQLHEAESLAALEAIRVTIQGQYLIDGVVEDDLRDAYQEREAVILKTAKVTTEQPAAAKVGESEDEVDPSEEAATAEKSIGDYSHLTFDVIDALQTLQTRLGEAKTVKEAMDIANECLTPDLVFPSVTDHKPITLKQVFIDCPIMVASRAKRAKSATGKTP